jgi:hypothetical protein
MSRPSKWSPEFREEAVRLQRESGESGSVTSTEQRRRTVEVPAPIEQAISEAVERHLETELGDRGLLLTADGLATATAEAAQRGTRLLTRVIHQCYPINRQGDGALAITFESERTAARIETALAFGAATARVLVRDERGIGQSASSVELMCAMFNLGIGLVDSLCDVDAEKGGALLQLIHGQDLARAAEGPRRRGWLRARVPQALAQDPTVAFTVDIIEVFFETLHASYPDAAWSQLRRGVGVQLGAALEAERQSVTRSADQTALDQLIEYSRLTSVLPFQIIETLASGGDAQTQPSAGTQLGEAMWRIDDLVDLCQDARSGSLNSVLLTAARPGERAGVAALARLLASRDIGHTAAEAAESLLAGLQLGSGCDDQLRSASFLQFIQRYAGIAPRQLS